VVEEVVGEEFVEHCKIPTALYFLGIAANDCFHSFARIADCHDLDRGSAVV